MTTSRLYRTTWAALLLLSPLSAKAADAQISPGDTAWILISSVFTFLMLVPGLALFYGGMVRRKNVLAVSAQCVGGCAVVSLLWIVCGYSLVFTKGSPVIGNLKYVMLSGLTPWSVSALAPTIPEYLFVMFELTFATITPLIVLGATADRLKFSAAMLIVALWTLLIYCPVAHMVWGPGGLLTKTGTLDFAGGTVVHITSGVSGLIAALWLGRRHQDGIEIMAPHNVLLTMLGGALLWAGWFCFNGGSALSASPTAALAILNSQIAAAAGLVSWTAAEWWLHGKPSLLGSISGAISGLVVITPACGYVTVTAALLMGLTGGLVCLWAVNWPKRRFRYDDALDVWAIHGVGGITGALLTGIFASAPTGNPSNGGFLGGSFHQFLIQTGAVVLIGIWSVAMMILILAFVGRVTGLRVSREMEIEGLDLGLHGEQLHT